MTQRKIEIESYVSDLFLGYFGCLCPPGISDETNRYVHYKFGSEEGWIFLSFSLIGFDAYEITLDIHEVLRKWVSTSVEEVSGLKGIKVFPNPVSDGILHFDDSAQIVNLAVFSVNGQLLTFIFNPSGMIKLPEAKGIYLVRVTTGEGNFFSYKILRE